LTILAIASLITTVFALGYRARTAIDRKHPDTEAVNTMGWVGFLAVVPYVTAILSLRLLFRAVQKQIG